MKKKEIKDAYPKKVCHMPTRHVKKKMHTRRRYATCPQGMPKKREKKKIARIQEKKRGRKRDRTNEFIHHPPNKNYPHTCTS
jgi:hypothetical protein